MVGNKIYNYPRYRLESGNFNGNMSTVLANSWRPDNQNTDIPRFSKTDGADNKWAYTDRWLEDGSYIRLKTLDIGYTLPKVLTKKIKLENVRIYTSMENLFTLTKYSGYTLTWVKVLSQVLLTMYSQEVSTRDAIHCPVLFLSEYKSTCNTLN